MKLMPKAHIANIVLHLALCAAAYASDLNNEFVERGELTPSDCAERVIDINQVVFPRHVEWQEYSDFGTCEVLLYFRVDEAGKPSFDLMDGADGSTNWQSISEFRPTYCENRFVRPVYKAILSSIFSELHTSTEC